MIETPTIDHLILRLEKYRIRVQDLPIKDKQYVCGKIDVVAKVIILNLKNGYKSNIDSIAHELIHDYYGESNTDEPYIEDLSQRYLSMFPEFESAIKQRLYDQTLMR